ncbi:polyprenyl synthetase family protein [Streptomyces chattanoogensis]|uniref:polyprenyl synthetase family protein n=1 Tax=Streptomyces chattanoogensis TaxID=66876 RepID=UPI0036769ACC
MPEHSAIREATDHLISDLLARERPRLHALGLSEHEEALRAFLLNAGGKRMRALFCYWGWRGASGNNRTGLDMVHMAAAALELNHSAFLIHDDILDRSELRRGQPTLYRRFANHHAAQKGYGPSAAFGDAVALNLGDIAFAWAAELIDRCTTIGPAQRPSDVYHRMNADACYGQTLELQIQADREYVPGRCLTVATYKAARYMLTPPLQIGAALAGADDAVHAAYDAFGTALGEAYQLRDDLLGVFGNPGVTGKANLDDLREGKPTVLFATALETSSLAQRVKLLSLYGRRDLDEAAADDLRALLQDTQAAAAVEEMIRDRSQEAARALKTAPITDEAKAALETLAAHALFRTR